MEPNDCDRSDTSSRYEHSALIAGGNYISSLPLDVRYKLLTEYVGPNGLASLSWTAKEMADICRDDALWRKLCCIELGTRMKDLCTPCRHIVNDQGVVTVCEESPLSYYATYTRLIYPLRGFIQQALISFTSVYGELLTLTYKNGAIYGELWYPAIDLTDKLKSTLDFVVYIDADTDELTVWNEFENENLNDRKSENENKHLNAFVNRQTPEGYMQQIIFGFRRHSHNPISVRKLRSFIADKGVSWSAFRPARLADNVDDDINAQARHFFDMSWSGSPLKKQSVFKRYKDIWSNSLVPLRYPRDWLAVLPQGLFQGTYGGHGNETIMVQLQFVQSEEFSLDTQLTGRKMTGDPNVPAGEVTFEFPTSHNVCLRHDQQDDIDYLEFGLHALQYSGSSLLPQPFKVPNSPDFLRRIDSRNLPDVCSGRVVGHATIAGHGYEEPQTITAHLVVFSPTKFLVLWFGQLNSASLFERISDSDRFTGFCHQVGPYAR